MKKSKFQKLHPNDKLDVLFDQLQAINTEMHPPFWKKALVWVSNNFFTLVILAVLIWLGLQALDIIEGVQSSIDSVSNKFDATTGSVQNTLTKFKFWD